ncbi:MAG: roadblock/LC7 domain-containing protein [Sideroxydans sp.]|nr:roadblock/LC7 domain-containing protein [Sideroxydans sp.]
MKNELQQRLDAAKVSIMCAALRELNAAMSDIEASAYISLDGYTIAAELASGVDSNRLGAICASMHALAQRASQEIKHGAFNLLLIESEQGYMLLVKSSVEAMLVVSTKPSKSLGMIASVSKQFAEKLKRIQETHKVAAAT